MTLQSFPPIPLGHMDMGLWGVDTSIFTLTAASYRAASVFQAPKAGTLNKVRFYCSTVTTGSTMECELQGVNASGHPDGTKLGSSTTGTVATVTATPNWYEATLSTGATMTMGQLFSIVVSQPASGAGSCVIPGYTGWPPGNFPRGGFNNGSWAKTSYLPNIFGIYSDGSPAFMPRTAPFQTSGEDWIDLNSSPDEIGNRFSYPFKHRVIGLHANLLPVYASANFYACMFRGTTQQEAKLIDVDAFSGYSARNPATILFDNAYVVDPDEVYRITIRPEVASSGSVVMPYFTYDATLAAAGTLLIAKGLRTYRTNLGSFTDDSVNRYVLLWPLIDQLDDGASAAAAAFFSRPNALLRR